MSSDKASSGELLTQAEVQKVARLARLELEPEEVARMAAELSAIIGYVQKLSELDTTDIAPTAQVHIDRLALREDQPRPSLPHDEVLAEAPRTAHDGFAVPGFIDE